MKLLRVNDILAPHGRVEIFETRGAPRIVPGKLIFDGPQQIYDSAVLDFTGVELVTRRVHHNILVNYAKDWVVAGLASGVARCVCRMAIGDQGANPSNLFVPKVPVATQTALFNEVFRGDIDAVTLKTETDFSSILPGYGTETVTPGTHSATFIKQFSATDTNLPLSSFSNQANPVVNEVGLILANLGSTPLPRAAVHAPNTPLADEKLFTIRCFKSIPFNVGDNATITIRYTLYLE